ncbi:hypothetical protein Tco_0561244 [Tanacetum coccineum]
MITMIYLLHKFGIHGLDLYIVNERKESINWFRTERKCVQKVRKSVGNSPVFIASPGVSGYGEVILNFLRGGNIAGDGYGDFDASGGGYDSDMQLLRDGAAVYSAMAASIAGGSTYDARTIFLSVYIRSGPLGLMFV